MEARQTLGERGLIDRDQFVRLIVESLHSLGYAASAEALEGEAGIARFPPEYHLLGHLIFSGQWEDCVKAIETKEFFKDLEPERRCRACFLIWQQCFLELLASQATDAGRLEAIAILRHRIAPLAYGDWEVHSLAPSIITSDPSHKLELIQRRGELFEDVVRNMPAWVRIPQRMLERLVEMASIRQQEICPYHNMPIGAVTLYKDHRCSYERLPWRCAQICYYRAGEVLCVQFSHNGLYLASSCRGGKIMIWKVEGITKRLFIRKCMLAPIWPIFMAWSPDDTMLLTFVKGEMLKIWNVEMGTCIQTLFSGPKFIVNSFAWFPDSRRILCDHCEPEKLLYILDLTGHMQVCMEWPSLPDVSELSLTPDGQHLIVIYSDSYIRIQNLQTGLKIDIHESGSITSLSLSGDGRFLIVNLDCEEIHLWSVHSPDKPSQIFKGHKQANHATRSCLGGLNSMFLASGSEDSSIYIWHRGDSIEPVLSLKGHLKPVNCVSWNPTKPYMLASASDDHTIRIWQD